MIARPKRGSSNNPEPRHSQHRLACYIAGMRVWQRRGQVKPRNLRIRAQLRPLRDIWVVADTFLRSAWVWARREQREKVEELRKRGGSEPVPSPSLARCGGRRGDAMFPPVNCCNSTPCSLPSRVAVSCVMLHSMYTALPTPGGSVCRQNSDHHMSSTAASAAACSLQ